MQRKQENRNLQSDSESDSDDSVRQALLNKSKEKTVKVGISQFRNKEGGPILLEAIKEGKENPKLIPTNERQIDDRNHLPSGSKIHARTRSDSNVPQRVPHLFQPINQSPLRPSLENRRFRVQSLGELDAEQAQRMSYQKIPSMERTEEYSEVNLNSEESRANLVRRREKSKQDENLHLDTSNKSRNKKAPEKREVGKSTSIFSGIFGSLSEPTTKVEVRGGKFVSVGEGKKRRNSNTSSNRRSSSSSKDTIQPFADRREEILLGIYQDGISDLDQLTKEEESDVVKEYLKLTKQLEIRRVYYDPEFDIINRFCLEYTSQCVSTENDSTFIFKRTEHPRRVFEYLQNRCDTLGTPHESGPKGPEEPTLLVRLILNDFRINSSGKCEIGINVPLFAHRQKMTPRRFESICRLIFARKEYFLRNTDISRHRLEDLA